MPVLKAMAVKGMGYCTGVKAVSLISRRRGLRHYSQCESHLLLECALGASPLQAIPAADCPSAALHFCREAINAVQRAGDVAEGQLMPQNSQLSGALPSRCKVSLIPLGIRYSEVSLARDVTRKCRVAALTMLKCALQMR